MTGLIVTLIVFGLIFGRWWKTALVVGTVSWVVLLLAGDLIEARLDVIAVAAVLAFLNTGVGVGVHQAVLYAVRRFRRSRNAPGLGT
ncbi:MAG TPA: hypothetical protein VIP75_11630 [Acidothermales bacterium]|jgi:hypothetical protein